MKPFCLLTAVLLLFAGGAGARPPEVYPSIDPQQARPLLVVAGVEPGAHFAPFPECDKPDVLCMDPAPFWFRARVLMKVFGQDVPPNLEVATTSHYGMQGYGNDDQPRLVYIQTDGDHFVMPRYASGRLLRSRTGELYLLTLQVPELSWLPCSVAGLREPMGPRDFPALKGGEFGHYAQAHPELFQPARGGAVPGFGISIARLSQHLHKLAPSIDDMECRQTDAPIQPTSA